MPIRLTTPENINISGQTTVATHVELAKFKVVTGDRVTNSNGTFTMQYGTMVSYADGYHFEGIGGAERHFVRRVKPATSTSGINPATEEWETIIVPEDNEVAEIMAYMGTNPSVLPALEATLAAGIAASETAAELSARVQTIYTAQGVPMLYIGVYTWLLVNGHFVGTPE